MSILEKKPYEISVWKDFNDGGTFIEQKVAIIGSDKMTTLNRAVNSKLISNINGTNTMTFDLYYRYEDNETGEEVDNPFVNFINNETKIKLHFNDKWYDFIVKNIIKDSSKKSYTYELIDLYINELSRNGFELEFQDESENNIGSIKDLAEKVIDETAWEIDSESDFIFQTEKEALFEITLTSNINAYKLTESQLNGIQKANTTTSFPVGTIIYGFYSCCAGRTPRFQFVYSSDGYETDDYRVLTNAEQYIIEDCEYKDNNDTTYGVGVPTFANNTIVLSMEYKANRYVFAQEYKIDKVLDKIVKKYKKGDDTYWGYTETIYLTPNLIENYVANNTDFKSTVGWRAGYIGIKGLNDILPTTRAIAVKDGNNYVGSAIKVENFNINGGFVPVLVNNGFQANKRKIKRIEKGEKFVCYYKLKSGTLGDVVVANGAVDPSTLYYDTTDTYLTFTNDNEGVSGSYKYRIAVASDSINEETFIKSNSFNILIEGNGSCEILDFQIFRYYENDSSSPILPDQQDIKVKENVTYYYYPDGDYESEEEINFITSKKEPISGYIPKMVSGCGKIRSIKVSNSNRFNILQELCETFECWMEFNIEHDYSGQILSKKIKIKRLVGRDNPVGFIYGINEKGIQRTSDSKEITTKLIVQPNSNEFAPGGFSSIAQATANHTGENVIYNFDYYINQEQLDAAELQKDLYLTTDPYLGYYTKLNTFNRELRTIAEKLSQISAPLVTAESNISLYKTQMGAAKEELGNVSNYLLRNYGINFYDLNLHDLDDDKNLFDVQHFVDLMDNYSLTDGDLIINSSDDRAWYNMPSVVTVELNTKYTISVTNYCSFQIGDTYAPISTGYGSSFTFTSTYTGKLTFKFLSPTYPFNVGKVKLEKGEVSTGYVEYEETTKLLEKENVLKKLEEGRIYLGVSTSATAKLSDAQDILPSYQGQYDSLLSDLKDITEEKRELNKSFFRKYSRFIQEGTWIDEKYTDNELYYYDALSVAYESSIPKVGYTIEVIDVSPLDGYEGFNFKIGDRSYIEDPEFFGYRIDESNGFEVKSPVREPVNVTEMTIVLENPEQNIITVQNYKTSFESLFQKITATVQQVQFATGAYEKASALAEADTSYKLSFLQDALNSAAMVLSNQGEQSVTWGKDGIVITDSANASKKLRLVSGGILLTEDGGATWSLGMTADGVNANKITTGQVDTSLIQIMNGNEPTFRWDAYGITAYDFNMSADNPTYLNGLNTDKGVRFDRFGIYGFEGIDGSEWHPTSINETDDDNSIDKKSVFYLTWDGLKVSTGANILKIGKTGITKTEGETELKAVLTSGLKGSETPNFILYEDGSLSADGYVTVSSLGDDGTTVIDGSRIKTGIIQSSTYIPPPPPPTSGNYSLYGMQISLDKGGYIRSRNFAITGTGSAYFKGDVTMDSGYIGGDTGWVINSGYISSSKTGGSFYITSAGDTTADYWIRAHNAAGGGGTMTFSVSKTGQLYATGAEISGIISNVDSAGWGVKIVQNRIEFNQSGTKRSEMYATSGYYRANGSSTANSLYISSQVNIGGDLVCGGPLGISTGNGIYVSGNLALTSGQIKVRTDATQTRYLLFYCGILVGISANKYDGITDYSQGSYNN